MKSNLQQPQQLTAILTYVDAKRIRRNRVTALHISATPINQASGPVLEPEQNQQQYNSQSPNHSRCVITNLPELEIQPTLVVHGTLNLTSSFRIAKYGDVTVDQDFNRLSLNLLTKF